jgi:hypothetical protein
MLGRSLGREQKSRKAPASLKLKNMELTARDFDAKIVSAWAVEQSEDYALWTNQMSTF